VEIDGRPLRTLPARARARSIGVLLQIEEAAYWGSVREYVLLGRFPHASAWTGYSRADREHAESALAAVGMLECAARTYPTLSGGERQRVRIAQLLAQQPLVMLLDEPLQHLDIAQQARMLALLADRARTQRHAVVMVLHEPTWIARACTHALVLGGDGATHAGLADEVLTRERLEHAYACSLHEVEYRGGRSFVPDV
jgi:iron complex transport system ATP-binding protein